MHTKMFSNFLTGLGCFCNYHCIMFLLFPACLHIMISHSIICAKLINFCYITLCFSGVIYFVLCGINNALLVSTIVIPSSQNIVASLCCWSVDRFIFEVAILRYDCKLALNTIVKKLSMAGTCKPSTFESANNKPPPFQFPHASYFLAPCIFACHSESIMTFAKCICKLWKFLIRKFWRVIMAPIQCHIPYHIAKHINDILLRSFYIFLHRKIKHSNMSI